MKRLILICLAVGALASMIYGSYWIGDQRGYHRALRLQSGTFVGTLDALDKIRLGDIDGGTRRIEALCFSSANIIYGDFVFQHDFPGQFVGNTMKDDLTHYRRTYRTNAAEWNVTEKNLEKHLAQWDKR
jgi:hypothetical protein